MPMLLPLLLPLLLLLNLHHLYCCCIVPSITKINTTVILTLFLLCIYKVVITITIIIIAKNSNNYQSLCGILSSPFHFLRMAKIWFFYWFNLNPPSLSLLTAMTQTLPRWLIAGSVSNVPDTERTSYPISLFSLAQERLGKQKWHSRSQTFLFW